MRLSSAVLGSVVLSLCVAASSGAQMPTEGNVSGNGSVEIKRPADTLRVQIELLAKGKDLKEALAKLKDRREAAGTQLAALGAAKTALAFGEPVLTTEKSDRQRQMEMMVASRVAARGKKPDPKSKQTPPVVVSVSLKADLPLKATSTEELLLAGQTLQDKIKALDLSGMKEFEKVSPQEEEAAEESAEMERYMNPSGEPKRGEPSFVFVSKIPEAEREKALSDAFQKARRDAARLAKAAGAELGALNNLNAMYQPGADASEGQNPYEAYYPRGRMVARTDDTAEQHEEAVGAQPSKVSLRVTVTAAFALKQAK